MSAIIHQFQQATGNERASILKDDSNVELLVQAVIEELQADSSESYKLVILLSVLEENAAILLHKADRSVLHYTVTSLPLSLTVFASLLPLLH